MLRPQEETESDGEIERNHRGNAILVRCFKNLARDLADVVVEVSHEMILMSLDLLVQNCLSVPLIVTNNLLHDRCAICFEIFQLDERFAEGSCAAMHKFHFDCILHRLRFLKGCPLCEKSNSSSCMNYHS